MKILLYIKLVSTRHWLAKIIMPIFFLGGSLNAPMLKYISYPHNFDHETNSYANTGRQWQLYHSLITFVHPKVQYHTSTTLTCPPKYTVLVITCNTHKVGCITSTAVGVQTPRINLSIILRKPDPLPVRG